MSLPLPPPPKEMSNARETLLLKVPYYHIPRSLLLAIVNYIDTLWDHIGKLALMKEPQWTTQVPTEEGFYWFMATGDFHPFAATRKRIPVVVLVHHDRRPHLEDALCVQFFTGIFEVGQMTGVWCGPLERPKTPQ